MNFTVDRNRFERYRAEAEAARGASKSMTDRVNDARHQLMDAQAELENVEKSYPGQPTVVSTRDDKGRELRRGESQHDRYLETARSHVAAAQQELARLTAIHREGAARRQHATQLFTRLSSYAQERGIR